MSRKNRGQRNTRKEKKESETVYSPTEKFVVKYKRDVPPIKPMN